MTHIYYIYQSQYWSKTLSGIIGPLSVLKPNYKEGGNRNIGFWNIIKNNLGFHGNKIIQSA